MAEVYRIMGQNSAALRIHEQVLEIRLKTAGPRHLDTACSYHKYGYHSA